jgi:hypothetical protein
MHFWLGIKKCTKNAYATVDAKFRFLTQNPL